MCVTRSVRADSRERPAPEHWRLHKTVSFHPRTEGQGFSEALIILPGSGFGLTAFLIRSEGTVENEQKIPNALPGIDVAAGVVRFNGNDAAYCAVLLDFQRDYARSIQEIRALLLDVTGDGVRDAARIVHTVKGVAGNLSAKRLYGAASVLEQQIHHAPEERHVALDMYEKALQEVITSISMIQWQEEKYVVPETASLEMEKITPLMAELSRLIDRGAYDAKHLFENLTAHLVCAPPEVRQELRSLGELLGRFDFKRARCSLSNLAYALQAHRGEGSV